MALLRNSATVRVKTGCTQEKIENFGNDRFLVKVTLTNHAEINARLKEMFSPYWGVPASKIEVVSGVNDIDKTLRIMR